ncbi:alpha/beta fold hydrolase [Litoribrevibacter euphylliae]|uniref:Alpha/beta fold hydrolase n=1 Tax=Litoribrevibacter euphylliae TaxID=1834034 RepID=A0ABV7HFU7_9GAMM
MNAQLQQWKSQGHYFEYLGHKVFYRDDGSAEKPCVICIHGFPTSSWDWHHIWPELSEHYRLIALDQLGFGFSDKPKQGEYSVMAQADLVEALLQSLGVVEYHVIAHDFGTLVAQELLDRGNHPEQTNTKGSAPYLLSLFAMSGSIFPELSNPRLIQKLLISRVGFLISLMFNQKKFDRSMLRVFSQTSKSQLTEIGIRQLLNSYWQLLALQHGNKQLHQLNFFLKDRQIHGERWARAWQESDVPIRYVVGEADPMYGKDVFKRLQGLSRTQDLHSILDVGHFPQIESPRQVIGLLRGFLPSSESTEGLT